MNDILKNITNAFNFNMSTAYSLSISPDLNDYEKSSIIKRMGMCHACACIAFHDFGDDACMNEYLEKKTFISKKVGFEL